MSQENVEIVRRWWKGFNEDGMPPFSLCDDAIEISNPPDFPVRGTFQGHDGVRQSRDQVFEIVDDAPAAYQALRDGALRGRAVVVP